MDIRHTCAAIKIASMCGETSVKKRVPRGHACRDSPSMSGLSAEVFVGDGLEFWFVI